MDFDMIQFSRKKSNLIHVTNRFHKKVITQMKSFSIESVIFEDIKTRRYSEESLIIKS